jgi:multicomponent Na+:H+ antiporter subunit E
MRAVSLTLVLFAFWLALAGEAPVWLYAAGAVCAILCTAVAHRMGALDAEGHPIHLLKGAVTYIPWLVWEIFKATWAVTRLVVNPWAPISPTLTTFEATQKSPLGLCIHANSITLTPGTITVAIDGDLLTVHALTVEGAQDIESGVMDARVTRFEEGA